MYCSCAERKQFPPTPNLGFATRFSDSYHMLRPVSYPIMDSRLRAAFATY